MTSEEAKATGIAYAWGREDASGSKTAEKPNRVGCHDFAAAFAAAWDEYNADKRGFMIPVRDAWEAWQASGAETIWPASR